MQTSRRLWWGGALILLGLLFLLDNSGYIDASDAVKEFWPVLLVIWGIVLLVRRNSPPVAPAAGPPSGTAPADADRLSASSVFGDTTMSVNSPAFKGGSLSSVFGDTSIDLSSCVLADGEQALRISSVFGDTSIRVPAHAAIAVSASTAFGSAAVMDQHRDGFALTLTYESPGYASAPKRLRVHVSQVFGDVRVGE
jgi:hypothetical protein